MFLNCLINSQASQFTLTSLPPTDLYNAIMYYLNAIRISRSMTQQQVAKALGFNTQNRISRWESVVTYPRIQNFMKLGKLH